jgi:intron-binding protein aquarius
VFLIDVTESNPKSIGFGNYLNLPEAEFCVGLYMLLRLQQVRPEYISVLSTFSAQARLLKEILKKKCGWHDSFGMPQNVNTVDGFKSAANNVVILSLVNACENFDLGKKIL